MIIRGCNNRPEDKRISLFVVSHDLKLWRAIDITYQELHNAIAGGFEVELIEDMYDSIERRLVSRMSL